MELLGRQEVWSITYDHALGETASYFFTQIRDHQKLLGRRVDKAHRAAAVEGDHRVRQRRQQHGRIKSDAARCRHRGHAASERAKPAFSSSSRSDRSIPGSPSRDASSPESGRATTTKS